MVQIVPGILATKEENFKRDILRLMKSPSLKMGWLHVDFADNVFVPNQTIKPSVVAKYETDLRKGAHIMVLHPIEWIDELVKAGFERIIFHLESKDNVVDTIKLIKSKGLEVGIAIKNKTSIDKLKPFVSIIDLVLIMSIEPGFQGRSFIPTTLDRIRDLKSRKWKIKIGVDGGVRDTNIKDIVKAGADFVTVGSYLLKGNLEENLERLWEALRSDQIKLNE